MDPANRKAPTALKPWGQISPHLAAMVPGQAGIVGISRHATMNFSALVGMLLMMSELIAMYRCLSPGSDYFQDQESLP